MNDVFIALVAGINAWVNATITFTPDTLDTWQTPKQTFERGAGDCEDIAIAKYFALRNSGVPASDLRLAYFTNNGRPHVALLARGMLLDVKEKVLVAEEAPVYEFNEEGLYVKGETYPIDNMSKWKNVLEVVS